MKCRISILCSLLVLMESCSTINIHQSSSTPTTQKLTLGSIGSSKDFILEKEFHNTAIPSYKAPIKVSVTAVPFNKQTFRTFTKAKTLQLTEVDIEYIDSLPNKPKYLQLQIADKVAVINALNDQENKAVKAYLSHGADANILTSISLALNQKDMEAIIGSDAVLLKEAGYKTYVLQLYKDAIKTQTIHFNQGVVFGYKTDNCCWQKGKTRQMNIVDLVGSHNDCPNGTYRSLKRAQKTNNYYKL